MHTTTLAAGNFLIPNGTFIAQLFAFLVVLAVLWRFVLPPVSKAMRDRQAMIKSQLDEGQQATERLKQAEAEYRKALEEARTTAATIRETARADAVAIREEILERAGQERDRIVESGREQLASERQTLVRELRSELGSLAVELASRILGESLAEEARQRGTVERFLAELGEGTEAAGAGGRR
jgi:F-type H+-transporting ATPase subunit b